MPDSRNTTLSPQKKSAARAKPARSAGDSVYTGSRLSDKKNATRKEITAERLRSKAARQQSRNDEQRLMRVADILLHKEETYAPRRRVWIVLLSIGLVTMVVSLAGGQFAAGVEGAQREMWGTVTTAALIAAYVCVIGALVYDIVKIRPMRNACQARARSMTVKAQEKLIYDVEEAEAAERRAKREAKEAAKAGKR